MGLNRIENRIGEIVFLNFPFTDLKGSKIRPALIIGESEISEGDYIVAYITTEVDRYSWSEFAVPFSEKVLSKGVLKYKSVIRVDKTILVHKDQFLREKVAFLTKEKLDEVYRHIVRACNQEAIKIQLNFHDSYNIFRDYNNRLSIG